VSSAASDITVVCQPSQERAAEFLESWVDEDVVPFYYEAVQRERAAERANATTQHAREQGPAVSTTDSSAAATPEPRESEATDAQKQPPLVLALKAIFRRLTRSLVHGMSSSGAGYGWSVGVYDELYVPSMVVTEQTPEEIQAGRERQQRRLEERQQREREREERRKRRNSRELTEEEIRRREVAVFVPWI
jgi:hypothetical protein